MNVFETQIQRDCGLDLYATDLEILQVNVGFRCNLSCHHCHLVCGPDRTEVMSWEVMEEVIRVANEIQPGLIDITGGSPELNPHLKMFIETLRQDNHPVQMRTNLAVLFEPEMEDIPYFLKKHKVRLVASLPCYLEENTCKQRGKGVYEKSTEMLKKLNALGYGKDPELPLHLVFNPGGPFLPPDQCQLEREYRQELDNRFGIQFSALYTITNMPIGRFLENLKQEKKDGEYMQLLRDVFNCQTVTSLMCRHQICVAWDGSLFDCDFNIALNLPLIENLPRTIKDFDHKLVLNRKIRTGNHCYGCTAGLGSSCGGALTSESS
ncbi:arsenosugar biosynthesis radical SAM (seleno)protein ArsS [Acidobacteriota bacterium]